MFGGREHTVTQGATYVCDGIEGTTGSLSPSIGNQSDNGSGDGRGFSDATNYFAEDALDCAPPVAESVEADRNPGWKFAGGSSDKGESDTVLRRGASGKRACFNVECGCEFNDSPQVNSKLGFRSEAREERTAAINACGLRSQAIKNCS